MAPGRVPADGPAVGAYRARTIPAGRGHRRHRVHGCTQREPPGATTQPAPPVRAGRCRPGLKRQRPDGTTPPGDEPLAVPAALTLDEPFRFDRGLAKRLRMREVNAKEAFTLRDGSGAWFRASLKEYDGKGGCAVAYERMGRSPEPTVDLTLACAVLARQRMHLVVQKATELGVRRIVPLLTDHSVPADAVAHEQAHAWAGHVARAARQCRRSSLPHLLAPATLDAFLASPLLAAADLRLFLDDRSDPARRSGRPSRRRGGSSCWSAPRAASPTPSVTGSPPTPGPGCWAAACSAPRPPSSSASRPCTWRGGISGTRRNATQEGHAAPDATDLASRLPAAGRRVAARRATAAAESLTAAHEAGTPSCIGNSPFASGPISRPANTPRPRAIASPPLDLKIDPAWGIRAASFAARGFFRRLAFDARSLAWTPQRPEAFCAFFRPARPADGQRRDPQAARPDRGRDPGSGLRGRRLGAGPAVGTMQARVARDVPGPARRHPVPRHVRPRLRQPGPRRLRAVLHGVDGGAWSNSPAGGWSPSTARRSAAASSTAGTRAAWPTWSAHSSAGAATAWSSASWPSRGRQRDRGDPAAAGAVGPGRGAATIDAIGCQREIAAANRRRRRGLRAGGEASDRRLPASGQPARAACRGSGRRCRTWCSTTPSASRRAGRVRPGPVRRAAGRATGASSSGGSGSATTCRAGRGPAGDLAGPGERRPGRAHAPGPGRLGGKRRHRTALYISSLQGTDARRDGRRGRAGTGRWRTSCTGNWT